MIFTAGNIYWRHNSRQLLIGVLYQAEVVITGKDYMLNINKTNGWLFLAFKEVWEWGLYCHGLLVDSSISALLLSPFCSNY